MVLYNAYRIVRQPSGDDGRVAAAQYFVQRPDGSECCHDVTWAEAERTIRRDMAEKGWPADSLPPNKSNGQPQPAVRRTKRGHRRGSTRTSS